METLIQECICKMSFQFISRIDLILLPDYNTLKANIGISEKKIITNVDAFRLKKLIE